jgi:hypothetical protein
MPDPETRTLKVAIAEGVEAKLAEAGVTPVALGFDIREIVENLVVAWTAEALEPYVRAPAAIISEVWAPGTPLHTELRDLISTNAQARRVLTGCVRWLANAVLQLEDQIDGEDDF